MLTSDGLSARLPAETARAYTSFAIFEATSEIQRVIIRGLPATARTDVNVLLVPWQRRALTTAD